MAITIIITQLVRLLRLIIVISKLGLDCPSLARWNIGNNTEFFYKQFMHGRCVQRNQFRVTGKRRPEKCTEFKFESGNSYAYVRWESFGVLCVTIEPGNEPVPGNGPVTSDGGAGRATPVECHERGHGDGDADHVAPLEHVGSVAQPLLRYTDTHVGKKGLR